jgi:hypothetical protein
LAAVKAEKAVLRMIAAESANSRWTLLSPSFVRRRAATASSDKIDKRSYYSESSANWWITSDNFFAMRPVAIVATRRAEKIYVGMKPIHSSG